MFNDYTIGHIKAALDLAERNAKTSSERASVSVAKKAVATIKLPSGVAVDGAEVPVDTFYSESDRRQMQQWGCN